MRNKKKWQSLAAWTLALSMAMGNSGVMAMAESTNGTGWEEAGFTDSEETADSGEAADLGEAVDLAESIDSEEPVASSGTQEEDSQTENANADQEEASGFTSEEVENTDDTEATDDAETADDFISDSTDELTDPEDSYAVIEDENTKTTYYLNVEWPDDQGNILPGEATFIDVSVSYDQENADGEFENGNLSANDFTLDLTVESDDEEFASTVTATVEADGENDIYQTVKLQAGNQTGEGLLKFQVTFNADEKTTLDESCDFWVTNSYDKIIVTSEIPNPEVGACIDFSGLSVQHLDADGNSSVKDNVEYEIAEDGYDTDIWRIEESKEGELPKFRRIYSWCGGFTVIAYERVQTTDEDTGEVSETKQEICRRSFWFDQVEYPIWFESDYAAFYNNKDYTIRLNVGELDNYENVSVNWQLGYTDCEDDWDKAFQEFTPSEDTKFWEIDTDSEPGYQVLTLSGEKLAEAYTWLQNQASAANGWFVARAVVLAEIGNDEKVEVARQLIGLPSCEAEYNYGLDEYKEMHWLPEDDLYIDRQRNCEVTDEDRDHEFVLYDVTDVTVENAEGEGETPVCLVKEDENGWFVGANRLGHAILKITYADVLDKAISHEFQGDIWIANDRYNLEAKYPENRDAIPTNSEVEVAFKLYRDWAYSEEEQGSREEKDYKLELLPDENNVSFDSNLIQAEPLQKEDGSWVIKIASKDVEGETGFRVKASVKDADGNWKKVVEQEIYVYINNNFAVIEGNVPENLPVGETFDLSDLKLVRYTNGEAQEIPEAVITVSNYDGDQWDAKADETETDDKVTAIVRKSPDYVWVDVVASVPDEEGELEEITGRYIEFGGIDYYTYFKENRGSEDGTWIFEDEQYPLTLDTENLKDKNVKINWEAGYQKDREAEEDFVPVSETEFGKFWSESSENPYSLIIDGAVLKTAEEALHKEAGENSCFRVRAHVVTNKGNYEVASANVKLEAKESLMESGYPYESITLIPKGEYLVENEFYCYVMNKDYPFGEALPLPVTDVTEKVTGESKVSIQKNQIGWVITGEKFGETELLISYQGIDGKPQTCTVEVQIIGVNYYALFNDSIDCIQMLNGEERTLPIKVYRVTASLDGETETTVLPADSYTLTVKTEGELSYNKELISSVKLDGSNLIVKTSEQGTGFGEIFVDISATELNDGKPAWSICEGVSIEVLESYYTVTPGSLNEETLKIGVNEILDLNKYSFTTTYTTKDSQGNANTAECKDVRYSLEYDEKDWECVTAGDDTKMPVLKRIAQKSTWVDMKVEQQQVDKYGAKWVEVARQFYVFPSINTTVCDHKWEVTERKEATCLSEGSITYTCASCKETKTEIIPKLSHKLVTVVDSQPTCGQPGKQHQECSLCHGERKELADIPATGNHSWKESKVTAATCTAEGSKEYTCSVCGQTKKEAIAKLSHKLVTVVDSQPTCGQSGKQHQECSLCHGERKELADIPATGNHTWSEFARVTEPTAAAEGQEVRTCSVCGSKENKVIAKLAPFAKVSATSFPMKKGQTVKLPVTVEKGDSVKTAVSKDTKKLTASVQGNTVTLKAGKKASKGSVKVTIQTACGASQTVTVKLQSGTVKAKKITDVPKTLTLKVKKSVTLKPMVTPISFQSKVTYKSSNNKIATVSKKGVIKAKKAGKVTITVKCDKITVKCKVTVKK